MKKMKVLRDTISNILEEMFFLVEETPPDEIIESYRFCTRFDDDAFQFRLLLGKDLATELTVNFLGLPDEPTTDDIADCLQEIVNMIGGNFIGKLYPHHAKLLPFPKTVPFEEMKQDAPDFESEMIFYRNQPMKIMFKEV